MTRQEKFAQAEAAIPDFFITKEKIDTTLGHDPYKLEELFGITKNDCIRMEREGKAIRARYAMENKRRKPVTGPHRIRWIFLKEGS